MSRGPPRDSDAGKSFESNRLLTTLPEVPWAQRATALRRKRASSPIAGSLADVTISRTKRESLFGQSFGAVAWCEHLQQMPIEISEVNAAATIPVVDFHVVRRERPATIR
jgi:hypothetical protein